MSQLFTTQGRRRRGLGIILLVIILLLILFLLLFFFPRPTATVTLTPKSEKLSNSLTASIPARALSLSEQDSKTGAPTGQPNQGTHATGVLIFQNYTLNWVTVPEGTSVSNSNGQQVITDATIDLPPDPPQIPGTASVSAHAANIGSSGNIAAMSLNNTPCCTSIASDIRVTNESAFSGGTDNQTQHTVQQSDIDSLAQALETSLTQKALGDIQKQLTSGEKLVTSAPQCSRANVTSNPGVGESAASISVTLSLACSASAYNPQSVSVQAENQLKQTAKQQLPGYILAGTITTTIGQVTQGQNGNVNVPVSASGTWKYQFTATQKSNMAMHIARETKSAAKSWLMQQPGVTDVSIKITGPIIDLTGDNTIPDDVNAITINS